MMGLIPVMTNSISEKFNNYKFLRLENINYLIHLVQLSHAQAEAVLVASASAPNREYRKGSINTNMLRNVERACCCCY
jgi:hypothetical protein